MKLAFLCSNHRNWLLSRPDEAIRSCATLWETGWSLYRQQRLDEALSYMGCALESAEILLSATKKQAQPVEVIEWFLRTLAGFTQTLKVLGKFEECKIVYQMAITRLEKESSRGTVLKTHIDLQVNCLTHELRFLNYGNQINTGQVNQTQHYRSGTAVH